MDIKISMVAVIFFIGSFFAATNDIAIDGYYMEKLDKEGQAKFVGYRVMAYRVAWITGTAGVAAVGTYVSWFFAFLTAAVIFGIFLIYHLFFLEEIETTKKKGSSLFFDLLRVKTVFIVIVIVITILLIRFFFQSSLYFDLKKLFPIIGKISFTHIVAFLLLLSLILLVVFRKKLKSLILKDPDSFYSKAFIYFIDMEKIGVILAFLILLRAGEWTLSVMVSPFLVDLGVKIHYWWISGFVGLPASIIGAILGGWMISRFTLKKVIWPFIFIQNFTNIVYMCLAIHLVPFLKINTGSAEPVSIGVVNLTLVALVHAFDQFAGGLGTAVLMTYLMRICHKEFKAAHYAIGSGLMNLSSLFAGIMSGFIAGWLGYAWLFGTSFVISIPGMLLIPFLPYVSETKKKPTCF
jgi:PAT family beta-lactamase induction signal transducer AmpG